MATSPEATNTTANPKPLSFDRVITAKYNLEGNTDGIAHYTFKDDSGNNIDGEIVSAWAEILYQIPNFEFLCVNYIGQPNNMEPDDKNTPGSAQTLTMHFKLVDPQKPAFIRLHAFIK